MATTDAPQQDALLLLRQSIASGSTIIPTTSEDATSATAVDLSLANATYLLFTSPSHITLPLSTPTRFTSSDKPVDLRSIYFAWTNRDSNVPEYNATIQSLNAEIAANGGDAGSIQTLAYVERLDLITWLEGASDEIEYIKPLASDTQSAAASAQVASGAAGGIAPVQSASTGPGKTIAPRLAEIYSGERKMGDRNSVLRGIKPTDFSHVRKLATTFSSRNNKAPHPASTALKAPPALQRPNKRQLPIIMLSPSATSLLRISNIKSFLEDGVYTLPDHQSANRSKIQRLIPWIDPHRPLTFHVAESVEDFRPEDWSRVAAVFTTGQAWQFSRYKWQNPQELWRNTLGVYIGWRGEQVPESVRGWGRGVMSIALDKYSEQAGRSARWRDREMVEAIWKGIEGNMKSRGWSRDSGPVAR